MIVVIIRIISLAFAVAAVILGAIGVYYGLKARRELKKLQNEGKNDEEDYI